MPTISALPIATQVNSTDIGPIVQGGTTKQAAYSLVLALVSSNIQIAESQVTNLTTDLANRLIKTNNLSDVTSAATSRINLGLAALNNGQLWIGSTGVAPVASTLTAGTNISISNAAGSITIASTGAGGFSWNHVTGTSQTMTSFNGYIADNGGLVTLTLPATSSLGDELAIIGKGAGGWSIAQGAGQQINIGHVASTLGAGGSVSSTNQFNSIYLVCTIANTTWTCLSAPQGNLTIV